MRSAQLAPLTVKILPTPPVIGFLLYFLAIQAVGLSCREVVHLQANYSYTGGFLGSSKQFKLVSAYVSNRRDRSAWSAPAISLSSLRSGCVHTSELYA